LYIFTAFTCLHARKGNIIKENYYIYQFKQLNELIEEQKSTKENDNQKSMFDFVIRHAYTPIRAPQGTTVYICHTTHNKTVPQNTA
jgi:hypothetical protein